MSGTRAITLSLSVNGAAELRRELALIGPAGEGALKRLDDAARKAAVRDGGLGLVGTSSREAARSLEAMGSRLGPIGAGLSSVGVGGAAAAAGIAAIGVGLAATARAGDQMVASLARLATATGSVQGAVEVYDQLYRLSLQTGVSVAESAGAFQRFAIAAREVGGTNEQALALVATLQRAAIVAGASGQEASAAAGQLAQALASGTLQGDELRSLLENMPSLAVALARELGVGVGELRKMGAEGQLTADRVLPALVRAGEQINEEFAKLPPTMERGFQQLGVATNRFLADLDQALGLSNAIARVLTGAAGAIDGARGALFRSPEQQARDRQSAAEAELVRLRAALNGAPGAANAGAMVDNANRLRVANGQNVPDARVQLQQQIEQQLAIIERAQIEIATIEDEGGRARFAEGQAAGERRLANENRQLDAGLAALRGAYDREAGVRETHRRAVGAIEEQLARGAIDTAEAQRLTAAAERERAESLRRLADAAPPAAAGLRQVRAATVDRTGERAAAQEQREWNAALAIHERGEEAMRRASERGNDARERDAEQSARDVSRYLADGFTDAFLDGERGFEGMLDSFKRLAIATPIRLAVEAVVTPIAQSAVGALGAAGGEGGIGELLGFAQAGRQLMGLLPGGGAGGISGLLNTPIGASFGSTATIGTAIGGVGGGFALGSLIGSFTAGDSRARQQNSQFGSGGGALAGAAIGSFIPGVGTVIGGLVGGALGGGLGGLIGPGRGFSGGDALIGVNDNGGLNVVGYAGKNFEDSAALLQQAQQQVDALNQVLAATGLTFARGQGGTDPGSYAAAIGGGESSNPRDLLATLNQAGVGGLRASDERVQWALDRIYASGGGSLETQIAAATEAGQFAAQIDALAQAARDAEDPIGAIHRAYAAQFDMANRLGFGHEQLRAQQEKAIEAVQKQMDAEKEREKQAAEQAEREKQRIAEADARERQRIADAAEQERLRAEQERAAEQRSRLNTANGFIEDVTFGSLSGNLTGQQRNAAARLALADATGAVRDGATQEELDTLRRIASTALPVIQATGGLTESFGALQREVLDAFRAAVPEADRGGLANVVTATRSIGDQITDAVDLWGNAQLIEQRALLEEMKRLAVSFSAVAARAA